MAAVQELAPRHIAQGARQILEDKFPGVWFTCEVSLDDRRWVRVAYSDGPTVEEVHTALAHLRDRRETPWSEDAAQVSVQAGVFSRKTGYSTVRGFQVVRTLSVKVLEVARRQWQAGQVEAEGESAGLIVVDGVAIRAASEMEQIEQVANEVVIGRTRRW